MAREEDAKVIAGFLRGAAEAIARVDGWINKVVRNPNWGLKSDLEDIVQEVRVKLLENFQNNKFGFRSSLETYVWRVTKYTCIDHIRCRKHFVSIISEDVELIGSQPNPEEELYEREQRAIFIKIVRSLPKYCRELWRMVFEERLPYAHIAKRLKISEGTVKSRFARCKEKAIELRRKFSGNFGLSGSTA